MRDPVAVAGTVFGRMELLADIVRETASGRWKCRACKRVETNTVYQMKLRVERGHRGGACRRCRPCTRTSYRKPKPTAVGDRYGSMEALEPAPNATKNIRFRCLVCGYERRYKSSELNCLVARGREPCSACRRANVTDEEKAKIAETAADERAARDRIAAEDREWLQGAKARKRAVVRMVGRHCGHEKSLICVDPGGVEIRRCRVCDVVGQPEWEPPYYRRSALFRYRYVYDSEDDPGFENAARLIEDSLSLT
jgi:hypothetical protein